MTARLAVSIFLLCLSCVAAAADSFPGKPVRIIVPTVAGSAPDVRVRQIAPKLAEALAHPVIVDNRPGANGTIATQPAAKSPADGPTVFYGLINNALYALLNPSACCRLNQDLLPV